VIMTSNVGSDLIKRDTSMGFAVTRDEVKTQQQAYEKMKEKVMAEMKNTFRPEFLNRIDGTVVFHALNKEHIREIVELDLKEVEKQLNLQGVSLEVTDAAKDWLGEKGFDQVFGARPLRRVIQNEVEDKLSEGLLQGEYEVGDTVVVDMSEDSLVFREVKQPELAASEA